MATGYQLIIGGVPNGSGGVTGGTDYSTYCSFESVQIQRSIRHRGSQMQCTVTINSKAIARPLSLQNIVLVNKNTGTNEFGGVIQQVDQVPTGNPNVYDYQLTCSDYTRWLDHFPGGATVYVALTVDALVKQLIADWVTTSQTSLGPAGPSVPLTTVHVNPVNVSIAVYSPNYLPISQAIDQIAQMVSAVWFIDSNADLWFLLPDTSLSSTGTLLNAPLPLNASPFQYCDQGTTHIDPGTGLPTLTTLATGTIPILDLDNDLTNYHDLKLSENASLLITATVATAYQAPNTTQTAESPAGTGAAYNKNLKGDGTTVLFPLNYIAAFPLNAADTTNLIVTATFGGILTTFTRGAGNLFQDLNPGQPTSTPSAPPIYCWVSSLVGSVRFNQAPDNNTNITVTYYNMAPSSDLMPITTGLQTIVAAREGYGTGYYFDVLVNSALTSPILPTQSITPWQAAELIDLARYGRIKIQADFHSYTAGWFPAQIFGLVSTLRGDTTTGADQVFTGWGSSIAMKLYVVSVDSVIVSDSVIDHHVVAANTVFGL